LSWCSRRGGPPLTGLEALKQVVEGGYEGYVTKDEASVYEGADEVLVEDQAEGLDGEEDGGGGLSLCRRLLRFAVTLPVPERLAHGGGAVRCRWAGEPTRGG
jgi:hypothetical protein